MKTSLLITTLFVSTGPAAAAPNVPIYLFDRDSISITGADPSAAGADEGASFSEAQVGSAFDFEHRAPNDEVSQSSVQYDCGPSLSDADDRGFDDWEPSF